MSGRVRQRAPKAETALEPLHLDLGGDGDGGESLRSLLVDLAWDYGPVLVVLMLAPVAVWAVSAWVAS